MASSEKHRFCLHARIGDGSMDETTAPSVEKAWNNFCWRARQEGGLPDSNLPAKPWQQKKANFVIEDLTTGDYYKFGVKRWFRKSS